MKKGIIGVRHFARLLTEFLIALVMSNLVLALVGRFAANEVGLLNHWLRLAFEWIGAEDIPLLFSWSWTTVFVIVFGVPFAAAIHFGYEFSASGHRRYRASAWLFVLPISCAMAIVMFRLLNPVLSSLRLSSPPGTALFGVHYGTPIAIFQYTAIKVASVPQTR